MCKVFYMGLVSYSVPRVSFVSHTGHPGSLYPPQGKRRGVRDVGKGNPHNSLLASPDFARPKSNTQKLGYISVNKGTWDLKVSVGL